MKVVSNTTPIISLSAIGYLSLLPDLFGQVYIPKAVYQEIKSKKAFGYQEIDSDFIKTIEIKGTMYLGFLLNDLDLGEAEAILLATEINADALIIDERLGYKIAQSKGINAIGTLSILLMAKEQGIIKSVKPLLDDMIQKGRWYSKSVYENFLKQTNEF
jgi:predicted nucleic acid-binding protein